MVRCVVTFDYDATQPDELTIKKGDFILDVQKTPGGWWEGVLNGKRGVFPDNFVEDAPADVRPPPANKPAAPGGGGVRALQNKLAGDIKLGMPPVGPKKPSIPGSKPAKQMAAVLFEYRPEQPDELELMEGDEVEIVKMEEEGWWEGVLRGKRGMFPSNFVKLLDHAPAPPQAGRQVYPTPPDHTDNKSNDIGGMRGAAAAPPGGRPPVEKQPKMPAPSPVNDSAPPPALPKRSRDVMIDTESAQSEDEPFAIDLSKKKLKTKTQRNRFPTHPEAMMSSSENMYGEHERSRRRRRTKKTKSKPDVEQATGVEPKVKVKKSKSPSPDDGYKPSDEALVFWGKAVASEYLPNVNKAKSLNNDRDIRKSAVSIKNKQSAPAKLAPSREADTLDKKSVLKKTRSKSRTTSPVKNSKSPEKTAKGKSGDLTKHREPSRKRSSKDNRHQSKTRPHKSNDKKQQSPRDPSQGQPKETKKSSSKKKSSKTAGDKKRHRSPSVKKKSSKEHTFEDISQIPSDYIASPTEYKKDISDHSVQNSTACERDAEVDMQLGMKKNKFMGKHVHVHDGYSQKVCQVRCMYEEGKHSRCAEQNERKHEEDHIDSATFQQTAPVIETLIELQTKTSAAPQVLDCSVQCDKSERPSAPSGVEQKLFSIEQTVKNIQSTMSELTGLIGSSRASSKEIISKVSVLEQVSCSKSDGNTLPMANSLDALNEILSSIPPQMSHNDETEEAHDVEETKTVLLTPEDSCKVSSEMEPTVDKQEASIESEEEIVQTEMVVKEPEAINDDGGLHGYVQETPQLVAPSHLYYQHHDMPPDTDGFCKEIGDQLDANTIITTGGEYAEERYGAQSSYIIDLDALLTSVPQQFSDGLVLEMDSESESGSEDEDENPGVIITALTDSMAEELEREITQKSPEAKSESEHIDGPANERDLLSDNGEDLSEDQYLHDEPGTIKLVEIQHSDTSRIKPWQYDDIGYLHLSGEFDEEPLNSGTSVATGKSEPQNSQSSSSNTEDPKTVVQRLKSHWESLGDTSLHTEVSSVNETERLGQLEGSVNETEKLGQLEDSMNETERLGQLDSVNETERLGQLGDSVYETERLGQFEDSVNDQTSHQDIPPLPMSNDNLGSTTGGSLLMEDDVSLSIESSIQSFVNPSPHILLPLQPEKKRMSLKSRLARVFGRTKKEKNVASPPAHPVSDNIDDMFDNLPPPSTTTGKGKKDKKSTLMSGRASRQGSIKSVVTESSASSIPKELAPTLPQEKFRFRNKVPAGAKNTIKEDSISFDNQTDNVQGQLDSLLV